MFWNASRRTNRVRRHVLPIGTRASARDRRSRFSVESLESRQLLSAAASAALSPAVAGPLPAATTATSTTGSHLIGTAASDAAARLVLDLPANLNGDGTFHALSSDSALGLIDSGLVFSDAWTYSIQGTTRRVVFDGTGPDGTAYHANITLAPATSGTLDVVKNGTDVAYDLAAASPNVSIAGVKYNDINGDGQHQAFEPGLANWTFNLVDTATGDTVAQATSQADGSYVFPSAYPGSYTVAEVQQAGWVQTAPAAPAANTVQAFDGQNFAGKDFGNFKTISVSGTVYDDTDGSGRHNPDEPALANRTINVVDGAGNVVSSATSDANGNFTAPNVGPGTYFLRQVLPTGWIQTQPVRPDFYLFTASSGVNINGAVFNEFHTVSVSGNVYNDFNGDAAKGASDAGLTGWTVNLVKGTTVVASAVSDALGNYTFPNVGPGSYTVDEVVQPGWNQTQIVPLFPVTSGVDVTGRNIGNFQTITVTGNVFNDTDGNGQKDGADAGLAAWSVLLVDLNGNVLASADTDANGNYAIPGIGKGTFRVAERLKTGWVQTLPPNAQLYSLTTTSGNDVAGGDFGNFRTVSISGNVYNDLNGDGSQAPAEFGLAGWTVNAIDAHGNVVSSAVTDGAGNFTVPNLGPGPFTLAEVNPAGWIATQPATGFYTINTTSGLNLSGALFGNFRTVSVSGNVYDDVNGNGARNTGEAGLAGWTVSLLDSATNVLRASAVTDASGNYSIPNVGPGAYTVREERPAGWLQTQPKTPPNYAVTPSSGDDIIGRNFGNFHTVTLAGNVYNDRDGNGAQGPGEQGVAGWPVYLTDLNGNIVTNTTTDAAGNYAFADVGIGSFHVIELPQSGWVQTQPTDPYYTVTTQSGHNLPTLNFGNFRTITITGSVYDDTDGGGSRGGAEPGLSNWTINLLDTANNVVASALSDAAGNFAIPNVGPGTYTLREVTPAGWVQTQPANPGFYILSPQSGVNLAAAAFGNFHLVSASGNIYNDLDGDGVQTNEPALGGFSIDVLSAGVVVGSGVSDANGNFLIPNLGPGSYTFRLNRPAGWIQTQPVRNADLNFTTASGVNVVGRSFGVFQNATVTGNLFNDTNGNGAKDAGEPGLSAWTVVVANANNGNIVASAQTDAAGNYAIANLPKGSYLVAELPKTGWVQTLPANSGVYAFAVATSGTTQLANFGNFHTITITGSVYDDTDGGGSRGGAEPGLGNWTVNLLDAGNNVVASAVSDAAGNFTIPNVGPGPFTLREVNKAGWVQTQPANPSFYILSPQSGVNLAAAAFGNFHLVSASGNIYNDLDGDGVQTNEPALGGFSIDVLSAGVVVGSGVSDANGNFLIPNLGPGSYTFRLNRPAGWILTQPVRNSDLNFTTLSGVDVVGRSFGVFQNATVTGNLFNDTNGNGAKDPGEPGLSTWTVVVANANNGNIVASAQTDPAGNYAIANLPKGSYLVAELPKTGWVQTLPANSGVYAFTVATSGTAQTADFGNFKRVAVSGNVYDDSDGSGTQVPGEPGLANWTVNVLDAANNVVGSALSDPAGNFTIPNVGPGTYTIREVNQAGWVQTQPANPGYFTFSAISGVNVSGAAFGNFHAVSVSGNVYDDGNGNGIKGTGESGLANWTVNLLNGATVVASATTDNDGNYTIPNVGPGSFTVAEVLPTGWIKTQPTAASYPVTTASGASVTGRNFGNFLTVTIAGNVYDDADGNGVKNGGENGIPAWPVYLTDVNGNIITNTNTDAAGNYAFPNVGIGSFHVIELPRAGWLQTAPSNPFYAVATQSGTDLNSRNFGNFRTVTVSGNVYNDANGNGVQDPGEQGAAGWDVDLLDAGGAVLNSASTDAAGNFAIPNVGPGTFTIREVAQSHTLQTQPAAPGTYTFTTTSGADVTGEVFGNFRLISVAGNAYDDSNGNGEKDPGEAGAAGWTVNLLDSTDTVVASVVSGASGNFTFTDVGPGAYTIREVPQADWTQTQPGAPGYYSFTATSGLNLSGAAFGNFHAATVSGTVYDDTNGNGARDAGEPGLSNWTVNLRNVANAVVGTATTDAAGHYAITGVGPGSFSLTEVVPAGWTKTQPTTASYAIITSSGGNVTNPTTFGNFQAVTLSGNVYNDADASGSKSAGESGLGGWNVYLTDTNGNIVNNTTSDTAGNYAFSNVGIGAFHVIEFVQSGWSQTEPLTPFYAITTQSGHDLTTLNFGNNQQPANPTSARTATTTTTTTTTPTTPTNPTPIDTVKPKPRKPLRRH